MVSWPKKKLENFRFYNFTISNRNWPFCILDLPSFWSAIFVFGDTLYRARSRSCHSNCWVNRVGFVTTAIPISCTIFFWFYSIRSAWAFGGAVHFVSITTSAMPVCCLLLGVSVEFLWYYIDSSALESSAMQNTISERVLSSEAITMDKWNSYWKNSHDLEINCLFSMLVHFVVLNVYFHLRLCCCEWFERA